MKYSRHSHERHRAQKEARQRSFRAEKTLFSASRFSLRFTSGIFTWSILHRFASEMASKSSLGACASSWRKLTLTVDLSSPSLTELGSNLERERLTDVTISSVSTLRYFEHAIRSSARFLAGYDVLTWRFRHFLIGVSLATTFCSSSRLAHRTTQTRTIISKTRSSFVQSCCKWPGCELATRQPRTTVRSGHAP